MRHFLRTWVKNGSVRLKKGVLKTIYSPHNDNFVSKGLRKIKKKNW